MRAKNSFPGWRAGMAALLLAVSRPDAQAAVPPAVVLDSSIRPVVAAAATGPVNPRQAFVSRATLKTGETSAMMTFEVALKMRNLAELKARVDRGEHVSSQELVTRYEPLATDYRAVAAWLTSQGFTVVREDSHHLAIFVQGSVGQIAQALKVNFARVTSRGKEYTSAVTAPSVPANIAPLLIGIDGLQPHIHAHKHIVHMNASSGSTTYVPSQIAQAYDATGLYSANITGAGQATAIVIDTFPTTSDLIQFWSVAGVKQSINNIAFIQVISGTLPSPSGEETLDTEWSSSIAPGGKVRVYAVADSDLPPASLDQAYQQIIDDATTYGIHQMSLSYGIGEADIGQAQVDTDDAKFVMLASLGVTVFASSGDEGPTPDIESGDNTIQAESPASDPNVTGVGGTSLTLDANNNESTEVVWNDGASGGASGGGASQYFAHSTCTWQAVNGVPIGTMREVPDISCSADPNFGAYVYLGGALTAYGGTSWGCPTCAGFCALINQERAIVGLSSIGALAPHLYALSGTANFRNITSGNNDTLGNNGFSANANGSYNKATGIGVPLVETLAETLAGTQTLVTAPNGTVTVNQGDNATFTVTTTGTPVSYQWQRMPVGTSTFTTSSLSNSAVYTGTTSATLTVTNTTTAMSGDEFQCIVGYSGTGTVTSAQPTVLVVETPWNISTLAGDAGTSGFVNSTGTTAEFAYPTGVVVDSSGNLYISDEDNNVIRKVTLSGSTATVTTPFGNVTATPPNNSGSTNGSYNNASFDYPRDIAIDNSNNLYVSDEGNDLIRKIITTGAQAGTVSTLSSSALLYAPKGISVDNSTSGTDPNSGDVFVADYGNNVILKITPNGTTTIFAGSSSYTAGYQDGAGTTQALFNQPIGLVVDHSGNIYVTDYGNYVIRKITPAGVVSTVAGQAGISGCLDGAATTQALFNVPRGIAVDGADNIYVTDSIAPAVVEAQASYTGNNILRKISNSGVVTSLAGQGGVAGSTNGYGDGAQFYNPCGLALNSNGTLYIADASNNTIRTAVSEAMVSVSATQPYASANGPVAGQFTVTRNGSTLTSVMVNYSLAGSTAVSNTDYTALPGSVTIPAGASSATIAVNPLSDPQSTANLTLELTLTGSITGLLIDSSPATVTISEVKPEMFSSWEASFSSPLTGASAALLATPWNDGVPNLLKYVFDIDPSIPMTSTAWAAMPVSSATAIGETNYLTLTYREYAGLTGINVNVQTSPDLRNWTTLTLTGTSPPTNASTYTLLPVGTDPNTLDPILQVEVPLSGTTEFIRLNVSSP